MHVFQAFAPPGHCWPHRGIVSPTASRISTEEAATPSNPITVFEAVHRRIKGDRAALALTIGTHREGRYLPDGSLKTATLKQVPGGLGPTTSRPGEVPPVRHGVVPVRPPL